jgi:hypothetical protein
MEKKNYLCECETNQLAEALNKFFQRKIDIPRIKHGQKQTIETLINEEALLFAKYLRGQRKIWFPRDYFSILKLKWCKCIFQKIQNYIPL